MQITPRGFSLPMLPTAQRPQYQGTLSLPKETSFPRFGYDSSGFKVIAEIIDGAAKALPKLILTTVAIVGTVGIAAGVGGTMLWNRYHTPPTQEQLQKQISDTETQLQKLKDQAGRPQK